MHEILRNLGPGQRVLDIGSGPGSFPSDIGPFIAIRADLDRPSNPALNFTRADAARLPFPDHAFDEPWFCRAEPTEEQLAQV